MANMEYSLNPPPMSKLGKYADEEEAVRDLPPCFVRSLAQLAVYDPARNATGPKLTVREAFRTFGRDKLEEAIEYGSAILLSSRHTAANALKNRRATLGVSHAEVARAAAASERDVRIAEEPLSEIPLRTLYRIALILGLDERYLSQQNSDSGDHKLSAIPAKGPTFAEGASRQHRCQRASRRDPPRPAWRRHCLDYPVSPEEPAPAYSITTMFQDVGIPTACPNAIIL